MALSNAWSVVAAGLLLFAGAAGCIAKDDSTLDTSEDGTGNGAADGGNGTASQPDAGGNGSASAPPNPPSVALSVTGDGVENVEDDNNTSFYALPAGANVTFDAAGSTDPAGGNLSYAWDLGNGTTAEGENITVAFAGGNITVTVSATSDASGLSAQRSVDLVVAAAAGAGGAVTYTTTTDLACQQCYYVGRDASLSSVAGDGLDTSEIDIAADSGGKPFELTATGDPDVWFYDSCGGTELEWFDNEGPEAGEVPAGATCAVVYDFAENGSEFTLVIG